MIYFENFAFLVFLIFSMFFCATQAVSVYRFTKDWILEMLEEEKELNKLCHKGRSEVRQEVAKRRT